MLLCQCIIEYSDNYWTSYENLWHYYWDEPNATLTRSTPDDGNTKNKEC